MQDSQHDMMSAIGVATGMYIVRVSFRIFVKGGGKHDNSRVKGGGAKTVVRFPICEK